MTRTHPRERTYHECNDQWGTNVDIRAPHFPKREAVCLAKRERRKVEVSKRNCNCNPLRDENIDQGQCVSTALFGVLVYFTASQEQVLPLAIFSSGAITILT